MATIICNGFEWDDAKATSNARKHGVTFEEALSVFDDFDHLVNADPVHPGQFIAVGFSKHVRVLVVVHVLRAERIRIVSARRATFTEEELYGDRRGS